LLGQHLLRDPGYRAFQVRVAQGLAAKKVEEDDELPSSFHHPDGVFDPDGGGRGRVSLLTHW
jgi:hypothetical protein